MTGIEPDGATAAVEYAPGEEIVDYELAADLGYDVEWAGVPEPNEAAQEVTPAGLGGPEPVGYDAALDPVNWGDDWSTPAGPAEGFGFGL